MSNETEIGEYVRTKYDGMQKVIKIEQSAGESGENYCYFDKVYGTWENEILKHSKNIIDLIEEGDYVNGMEIDEFDDEEGNLFLGIPIYNDSLMDCIEEVRPLSTIDIKTILTHEQYEQNCYKVKE